MRCSVTSEGSSQARLQRALRTGDPLLVRAAAAEMPRVGLDDALAICLVLLDTEPARYEPAAVRFLGRLLIERRGLTLADAQLAAGWLSGLGELCDDVDLERAAQRLRERLEGPQRRARP